MSKRYRIQCWATGYRAARWRTLYSTRHEDAALAFVDAYCAERDRDGDMRYPDLRLVLGSDVLVLIKDGQPREPVKSLTARVDALEKAIAQLTQKGAA